MAYDVAKRPGDWVRVRARRREQRVWVVISTTLVLMILVVWVALGLRNNGLALALLGGMYLLYRIGDRQCAAAVNWIRGARSEIAVGETLNELRRERYVVMHDLEQAWEGNIDHLVSGPSGVFLIETKYRRYETEHLTKAKRQAARLGRELDIWVTPVICLDRRRGRTPYRDQGVWIVCRDQLSTWLSTQRNAALPFERLVRFADNL